jgi:hypothetical protein
MEGLLQQLLRTIWRAREGQFWLIWSVVAFAAATCTAWVLESAPALLVQGPRRTPNAPNWKPQHPRPRVRLAVALSLSLFLMCSVAMTLVWEDFTYYDSAMFTVNTLRGHNILPPIWREDGRFFPLGHQEFNLIRHFTSTAAGYQLLPAVELLILGGILLLLDDELTITARAFLATIVLITPSIVSSFGGLIFTERNIVLLLACLALFVKRFEQTKATVWGVAAVVCAQMMIYYKETAFVLIWGFAIGRLVLRCRNASEASWDFSRLRDKESRLDLCLVALGVLFLAYYTVAMLPHPNMRYANEWQLPRGEVVLSYMKVDLLAWLLVALLFSRIYLIVRQKVAASPLWDGLALGGVACFASYLYLGMFISYYMAPVDLIAVLCVGRYAILSMGRMPLWGRVASMAIVSIVLIQAISLSAYCVFERKNLIHGKAELAHVVEMQYRSISGSRKLFFPFATPVHVMEVASYLRYKGVPLEETLGGPPRPDRLVMVSKPAAKDGLCVAYVDIVCHAGRRPDRGDLVVVLPDDEASLADVAPYRDGGELVFLYQPRPAVPQWLSPFKRYLDLASPHLVRDGIPERWLDASVTVWK